MPREYVFCNATQSRARFYHTYLVMSFELQRRFPKKWVIPTVDCCGIWCSAATNIISIH